MMCKERLREIGLIRLEEMVSGWPGDQLPSSDISSGVWRRNRLRTVRGAQQKDRRQCSQGTMREIPNVR